MRNVRGINRRARHVDAYVQQEQAAAEAEGEGDVDGRAPIPIGCIGNVFNPGWETNCAALETTRQCHGGFSYHSDTKLCTPGCWWPAQVPDTETFPDWGNDCGSIYADWQKLCFVPD